MSLDRHDAHVVETRLSEMSAVAAAASVQAHHEAGPVSERAKWTQSERQHPSPNVRPRGGAMKTLTIRTTIGANHQLTIPLPEDFPPGPTRVLVRRDS